MLVNASFISIQGGDLRQVSFFLPPSSLSEVILNHYIVSLHTSWLFAAMFVNIYKCLCLYPAIKIDDWYHTIKGTWDNFPKGDCQE